MLTELGMVVRPNLLAKFEHCGVVVTNMSRFEIDFENMITVLSNEMEALRTAFLEVKGFLSDVIGRKTDYVDIEDLRVALCNKRSPSSLRPAEFDDFVKSLFPSSFCSSSQEDIYKEKEKEKEKVHIDDVMRLIVLGSVLI